MIVMSVMSCSRRKWTAGGGGGQESDTEHPQKLFTEVGIQLKTVFKDNYGGAQRWAHPIK